MPPRSICSLFLLLSLMPAPALGAEEGIRVDRYGDPLPPQALERLGTVRFRHGEAIGCLAYSPDGKILASGGKNRGEIVLWEAESGRKICSLEGNPGGIGSLTFSPNSKLLISTSTIQGHGALRLWDVATTELMQKLDAYENNLAVAFLPDGKTIAGAYCSKRIRLWDMHTGKLKSVVRCEGGPDKLSSSVFAPDCKSVVGTAPDGKVWFWNVATGKELPRKEKALENVLSMAFSPDGTILATGSFGGIGLYRSSTLADMHPWIQHQGHFRSLTFDPAGKMLVSMGDNNSIHLWDAKSGKHHRLLVKLHWPVRTVAISPDGKTVAAADCSQAGVVKRWDVQTGAVPDEPPFQVDSIDQIAFLPGGGSVVLCCGDSGVFVWPLGKGKKPRSVELPPNVGYCPLGSDRSTLAVTTNEWALRLLDIPSGRELLRCPMVQMVQNVVVSANNKRAAVKIRHGDNEVWDLSTKKIFLRLSTDARCLAFSADGEKLAVSVDDYLTVWDLHTKKEICRCEGPGGVVWNAVFSPDGRMLAVHSFDYSVRLWEIATSQERLRLQTPDVSFGVYYAIAFSPDGRTLATGNQDHIVRLWDVRDGKELEVFRGHFGAVHTVDFSPDGRRLISGSADTTALIWEIPLAYWDRKPAVIHLAENERDRLWKQLAEPNAKRSYAALQHLATASADALLVCQAHLVEISVGPDQIQRWIVQLDDEDYTVREQASRHLERVGGEAHPALERTLKGDCSPEVRQRIKALLEANLIRIRKMRAVELLEQIGTAEAVDFLKQLAMKTSDPGLRAEAEGSLRRLGTKRRAP